jgi:hypothetical protein
MITTITYTGFETIVNVVYDDEKILCCDESNSIVQNWVAEGNEIGEPE